MDAQTIVHWIEKKSMTDTNAQNAPALAPLAAQIDADLQQAMRDRDEVKKLTLRAVKTALTELAKAGANHALSQEQVVTVVQKEAKRRREAALEYEKGGATARVNAELAELAVLEAYLPKALSDAEVEELARQVIAEVGATTPKELGKVMGPLVARVNGSADGKVVSATVRRLLGA